MFQDLDATIAALCADATAPHELRAAEISFATPGKDYNPTAATVNFFLHGLRENRDLHTSVPVFTPVDEHFRRSAPPMRMDCSYLVTTWSSKSGELKVGEEHRLLGTALVWLCQFTTIPDSALAGSLKDPPQPYVVTSRAAQASADESLAHFWSALSIAPRPTFAFTVTISMQASVSSEEVYPVEVRDIEVVSRNDPTLTGRIIDEALTPAAGARVKIVETNQTSTADRQGRFSFGELPFGHYTLLVEVPGRPDVTHAVEYQDAEQTHHVLLPNP